MLPHLVAFRSGLWWQPAGGEELSSALQFSRVPMEHLKAATVGSLYFAGACCLCSCRLVQLTAAAEYIYPESLRGNQRMWQMLSEVLH